MGNNIEYDAKACQVKMTIVKCTNVRLKGLRLTSHRNDRWHGQRVHDAMKQTQILIDHVSSFNLNRQYVSPGPQIRL